LPRESNESRRNHVKYDDIGGVLVAPQQAREIGFVVHAMTAAQMITVHVPGALRAYCGGATELSIAARTVRAALEELERNQAALYRNICDETGTVRRHLNVFVNADNVRDLDGIDTTLRPGDVLTILPAVSGG
jgi:molybdopterin synthase sulfur carrier subunit